MFFASPFHQAARQKKLNMFKGDAVAGILSVPGLADFAGFVDKKVGRHQVGCEQTGQSGDFQALQGCGQAADNAFVLAEWILTPNAS